MAIVEMAIRRMSTTRPAQSRAHHTHARHCPAVPHHRRSTDELTASLLPQANDYAMIARRAAAVGINTKIGNHAFRATGIMAYLSNDVVLEKAAAMANHASTLTTQLYDRRPDEVSLDEIEHVVI